MRLIIRDSSEDASEWCAKYIKLRILDFNPTEERPFVLGLPTGSSPIRTYALLADYVKRGELSFKHVITFNMDEYVGISEAYKDQSYHHFMWEHLFSKIDIKPENAHILNGDAKDLELECTNYEKMIESVGGIELFFAGIGEDGHIAFNEPGSSLASKTRVKTLAYSTVVANARFFGHKQEHVPKLCLTVGVGTVMAAREILIIVLGPRKAHALQKCIEEGVNHMYTASTIQLHRRSCIVCDEDATLDLKVRTVRYFKGLEKIHQELHPEDRDGFQMTGHEIERQHSTVLPQSGGVQ